MRAFCDEASPPPFGASADARRPTLAVVGLAGLLAPACLALAMLAFGAWRWRVVVLAAAPAAASAKESLVHLVSEKSLRSLFDEERPSVVSRMSSRNTLRSLFEERPPDVSLPAACMSPPADDAAAVRFADVADREGSPETTRPSESPPAAPQPSESPPAAAQPSESLPAAVRPSDLADALPVARVALSFRDLGVDAVGGCAPKKRLVHGIHGKIAPSTITAIIGPSGSGKTTLLKVLAGREASYGLVASGQVRVEEHVAGASVRRTRAGAIVRRTRAWAAARTQFSSFSTEIPLSCSLSTGEQLRFYALTIPIRGASTAARLERADAVAREIGLSEHDATRTGDLSEGQYRRLLVAIRLLVLPSVLALDELTSGQDATTALALMRGATRLARRGLTVLVVIHQPSSEVLDLFDKVLCVRPGGDGCHAAAPADIVAAVASLRQRRPGLPANAAEVFLDDALRGGLVSDAGSLICDAAPVWDDEEAVEEAARGFGTTSASTVALALARYYRAANASEVLGYALTAAALAVVLIGLFGRASARPASTMEGGDVVFVTFIGLTTLCGISNFQANCVAAPVERTRFERNAASGYETCASHFATVTARDFLTVCVGATPFFLAVYAGCSLGPASRLAPCIVVFLLTQHAFHATGSVFFYIGPRPDDATVGIVCCGIYNFLIFLLGGVVMLVSDMSPFWSAAAHALPGYHAMGLMTSFLFKDRPFNCEPLAFPEQCSGGDDVIDAFGFGGVDVTRSLAVIVANYAVARLLLFALLVRATQRRVVAPLEGGGPRKAEEAVPLSPGGDRPPGGSLAR